MVEDRSYYYISCGSCGENYKTITKVGTCPYCGVAFEIIWPDIESKEKKDEKV